MGIMSMAFRGERRSSSWDQEEEKLARIELAEKTNHAVKSMVDSGMVLLLASEQEIKTFFESKISKKMKYSDSSIIFYIEQDGMSCPVNLGQDTMGFYKAYNEFYLDEEKKIFSHNGNIYVSKDVDIYKINISFESSTRLNYKTGEIACDCFSQHESAELLSVTAARIAAIEAKEIADTAEEAAKRANLIAQGYVIEHIQLQNSLAAKRKQNTPVLFCSAGKLVYRFDWGEYPETDERIMILGIDRKNRSLEIAYKGLEIMSLESYEYRNEQACYKEATTVKPATVSGEDSPFAVLKGMNAATDYRRKGSNGAGI